MNAKVNTAGRKNQTVAGQLSLFSPSDDRCDLPPVHEEAGAGGQAYASPGEKAPWYNPELARAGTHFFCLCCFGHKPLDDRSPDGRYCQDCCDNLWGEWQHMANRGVKIKPGWVPRYEKVIATNPHRNRMRRTTIKNKAVKSSYPYPNGGVQNSTDKNGLSKKLPKRKIKNMAAKGMRPKRIAAELLKLGYKVNYRSLPGIIAG